MRLVILVGAARSGTKLLRDTLATGPGVAAVPYDINYVWRLGNEDSPDDALDRARLRWANAAAISKYMTRVAGGHEVLIEKTVATGLRVPFVYGLFPDAEYVLLVRDPVDVVESAMRQWMAKPDWRYNFRKAKAYPWLQAPSYATRQVLRTLRRSASKTAGLQPWGPVYPGMSDDLRRGRPLLEVCAEQWRSCNQSAVDGFLSVGITPRVIRYEAMCSEPSRELTRLTRQLHMPAPTSSGLSHVDSNAVGMGRRRLSSEQVAVIEDITGPATRVVSALLT